MDDKNESVFVPKTVNNNLPWSSRKRPNPFSMGTWVVRTVKKRFFSLRSFGRCYRCL